MNSINKTQTKKTAINRFLILPIIIACCILVFALNARPIAHAQYGSNEYGSGAFSAQQTNDPSENEDDGQSSGSSSGESSDEDELAETGRALDIISFVVPAVVIVLAVVVLLTRSKKTKQDTE